MVLFLSIIAFALFAGLIGCARKVRAFRSQLDAVRRELKTVFDVTGCATIVTGKDRLILHANHVFENMIGRPRAEIEGKLRLDECIDPESLAEIFENQEMLRHYPYTTQRRYRTRLRSKAGSTLDAQINEGLILGTELCVTSILDVSAATVQEISARETLSKYQSIFENVAVGIFQTTAEGRYHSANKALAKIYGYDDATELIGKLTDISRQLYVDPLQRGRFKQAMDENEEIFDFESEVYRKDGTTVWIRENARVVRDLSGRFLYYEGIVEDITRRHRFECELREAETELRRQNKRLEGTLAELKAAQSKLVEQERLHALGQMASGIAHDFNNALSPILGYSDLLLKQPALIFNTDRVRHIIEMIHTSAKDAASIVRGLRNLYRSAPRAEKMRPMDLAAVVRQTIELTQPRWRSQALEHGAGIEIETDLAEAPKIMGDESEIRESLTNLIFNAVDAMPAGGKISIKLRPEPSGVLLEIADSGKGMPQEVRAHCFEPFFTTKGERGTGLGLAMVYSVVMRHEGAIEVDSEIGRFTKFRIRLPLSPRNLSRAAETAAIPLRLPARVLAVDDEPMLLDIVRAFLELEGCVVATAQGGDAALKLYDPRKFDLVVLDQGMPGMSGDALAARIRELAPSQPILMLTGFGDLMLARGEKPAGVDFVLGKPVTRDALRKGVAHAMHAARIANVTQQASLDSMLAAHEHLEHEAERAPQGIG